MKKAKIILTCVAFLGAVGGALAIKANMRSGILYCTTISGNTPAQVDRYQPSAAGTPLFCTPTATPGKATVQTKVLLNS